jgi:Flp pilus assembly protein TadG
MAIAATAVLLLLAAVGGGIDMSRAYMAKTNLQSACDAGVLAGRKAMAASGEYTDAEKAKANKMFNFNAKLGATNSTLVVFDSAADDEGAVNGEASITMPTVIMKMFGFRDFDLSVQCSAELQMASADIVFVLDTTGSMAETPAGKTPKKGEQSKIDALRDALREFHKTIAAAVIDHDQTRIRYAFVPYSMTVNVGGLISSGAMPANYLTNTTAYQTRLAQFGPDASYAVTKTETLNTETETSYDFSRKSRCTDWGNANPTPVSGGPPPADTTVYEYSPKDWSGSSDRCTRTKKTVKRTYNSTPYYKFNQWIYKKWDVSTAGFTSGSVTLVTDLDEDNATAPSAGNYDIRTLAGLSGASGLSKSAVSWSGCIEERNTVVDLGMDPVPAGAYDLDINSAPISDPTRWKPYIGAFEFDRGSSYPTSRETTTDISNESEKCPAPIRQFEEVDTRDPTEVPDWLETYITSLNAAGNTYHDLGMIWGARIGSTRGIFASNVNAGSDRFPSVSRHIIFMTDGIMEPTTESYSAYGLEKFDHRVAPSGTSSEGLKAYHNSRFLAACRAAEAEGYTVWAIAFGVDITSQMLRCSTAERAFKADDATELNNTFRFIAGQVADLRINK